LDEAFQRRAVIIDVNKASACGHTVGVFVSPIPWPARWLKLGRCVSNCRSEHGFDVEYAQATRQVVEPPYELLSRYREAKRGKPFTASEIDRMGETTCNECQELGEWIGINPRCPRINSKWCS
jgi:hypothetical protein